MIPPSVYLGFMADWCAATVLKGAETVHNTYCETLVLLWPAM